MSTKQHESKGMRRPMGTVLGSRGWSFADALMNTAVPLERSRCCPGTVRIVCRKDSGICRLIRFKRRAAAKLATAGARDRVMDGGDDRWV